MSSTIHLLFLSVYLGPSTVFLLSANYLFCAVTLCSYSFEFLTNYSVMQLQFFPELILHKYSVEGYVEVRAHGDVDVDVDGDVNLALV